MNYVASALDSLTHLKEMGLTVEQEGFNAFMAT